MSKRFLKFLASTALALLLIANSAFAAKAYYYDWPTKNKSTWKITPLGASKVKLVAEFKHAKKHGTGTKYLPEANSGYTVGGGVVTENYYVFAVYKDEKSTNFVYFANRSDSKIVNVISGNWKTMGNLYYKWGSKHVRVESSDGKDSCFHETSFKSIDIKNCKTKRAENYGAEELTSRGRAQVDNYIYHAGWDSGDASFGQKWYSQRNSNAVFIHKQGTKALVRTLYIPKSVVNGEAKDVSLDGAGNAYIFFYQTGAVNSAAFYMVNKSSIKLADDKNNNSGSGSSSGNSGGSSNPGGSGGGGGSGSRSGSGSSGYSGGSSGSSSGGTSTGTDDSKVKLTPYQGRQCAVVLAIFCESVEANGEQTILELLAFIAGLFTMGFGTMATISLIWSGYMYLTARENENQIVKAKQRIRDLVLGIIIWILLVACVGLLLPDDSNTAINEVIQGIITHLR